MKCGNFVALKIRTIYKEFSFWNHNEHTKSANICVHAFQLIFFQLINLSLFKTYVDFSNIVCAMQAVAESDEIVKGKISKFSNWAVKGYGQTFY